ARSRSPGPPCPGSCSGPRLPSCPGERAGVLLSKGWAGAGEVPLGGRWPASLVGVRFLPEVLAADVDRRVGLDGAVAVDLDLAGRGDFGLVPQAAQHAERVADQVQLLDQGLLAEVLHALLDQDATGAAHAVAAAVEVALHGAVDLDPGLAGFLAQ